jgi:hypothetical protein
MSANNSKKPSETLPKTCPRISHEFGKTFSRRIVYLHAPGNGGVGEIREHSARRLFQILTHDKTPDGCPGDLDFARQRLIRDCEALKVAIHTALLSRLLRKLL